jgi:rare lipoprotein A
MRITIKILAILGMIAFLALPFMASCQTATYYADSYEGKPTKSGDIFYQWKMTCASNNYPFGTILRVSYKAKFVDVRVNDRMRDYNVIDLSKSAFMMLADTGVGRLRKIKIKIIKK